MTKHDSEHCVDMDTPSPEELAQSEVDFQDRLKRGDFRDLILIKDGHVTRVGDRVVWRHIPRGGYGYVCRVPATVVAVGRARVTIEAALERGGVKRVCVRPESLEADKTDQERWSKATPGPWSVHPDPEAIASAPEEVRVLLEEIDRLHARAERAEKLLGRFREEVVAAGCPSGDSDHQLHHLRRLLESVREDRQRIEPELRDMDVESARPHLRRRAKVLERGLKALSAWCGDDIPQMEPRHDAQALMELLAIVVEGLPGSRAVPAPRSTPPLLLEKLGFDIAELLAIAARSHRFAGRHRRRRPGRHGSAHGRKQR